MNHLHASWDDLSAEQQPFVFYSKKRDILIVCDPKVNIQISTDYTADIKVNIAIFEYGGIGTKKFQFDNPTEADGSYTPKSVVLLYKPYRIELEFCHSAGKERLVVRVNQIEESPGELVVTKSYPPIPPIQR